jgi:hypothetical protein
VRILIIAVLILLLSSNVYAGTSTGKITILGVNKYDQALVFAGEITDAPECSSWGRFVADLSTNHGRAMYSMMLTARAQGKQIRIVGQNICNVRVDAESIQYIEVVD